MRSWFIAAGLLLVLAGGGCSQEASVAEDAAPTEAVEVRAPEGPLVVFLGDSLTAGYGLGEDQAFPALLGAALRDAGRPVRVVNAGVSGDTSAGGLRRLPWLLAQHPDVLVVALGANDGLRGLAVSLTEENLRRIVADGQRAGARVLLLGLRLPPNLGTDYVQAFEAVYPRVARETGVPLVPFFLEGVGGVAELNQEDGIHPTAEGQRRIAATVLPYLRPLVPEL
ncbi:MAG TPA: arylesterase [Candidatus Polarisedimenticolaceae bacterium]|nr:arylesterase [Candidatus Polarisedimenticolaceae bacterium]